MFGKILILLTLGTLILAKSQYFDVILDRFENLGEVKEYSEWKLKVRKVNKTTRALFGDIMVHKPIGNDYFVEVAFYKKQGRNSLEVN